MTTRLLHLVIEPRPPRHAPNHMIAKLKWIVLALVAAFGIWLTLQNGITGNLPGAWNCAASKAIFCLQR